MGAQTDFKPSERVRSAVEFADSALLDELLELVAGMPTALEDLVNPQVYQRWRAAHDALDKEFRSWVLVNPR